MRTLLRPQWLLLTNTLPLVLLGLLCAGEYSVIHTLLPPESQRLWLALGLGLAGLGLAVLVGAGLARRRPRPLSLGFALGMLLAFSAYLAWWTLRANVVQPRAVPTWMLPTSLLLYAWTFLMPTLVHALLVVVIRTTPGARPQGAVLSLLLAFMVPLGAWLLGWLVAGVVEASSRWLWGEAWLGEALVTAFLVLGPLLFLYFLARACYILVLRRADGEVGLLGRLLLGVGLPVAGLVANAQLENGWARGAGVFGDFTSPWFFGLAVLNGLLLSVPARRLPPRGQLALLAGRSVLLGYTGYFFVVFLPWLPFSMLAIILLGAGLLLLAPLLLLLLHVQALGEDVAALRPRFGRWPVRAVLLGGAAVLPLALTASYYHSRLVLHQALDYAFSPDYARRYQPLDAEALAGTLAVVRRHKDQGRGFLTSSHQPYLSAYFNWLVLDNLTLSDDKLDQLEKLFGQAAPRPYAPWATPRPASLAGTAPTGPRLRHLTAHSTYDARRQLWVSQLDLEIANPDTAQQRGEYATAFALPPGCWVSGYYLEMNGRRTPGILSEQKAADWLFRQVVNEDVPRDPGLLTYAGPDHLRLHVYPVQGGAPRRTGFTLLHREPVTLTIEGQVAALGDAKEGAENKEVITTPGGAVSYLSAAAQQRLPLVRRQPYYHFLLDVSAGQGPRKAAYQRWIAAWLAAHPLPTPPRYTLVSAYATPVPAGADWPRQLDEYPNAGGYNLGGALHQLLADAWQHPTATYPVPVAVTDSLPRASLPDSFAEFAPACPEGAEFMVLTASGAARHSLLGDPLAAHGPAAGPLAPAVRAWPTAAHARAYLPAGGPAAVVLNDPAALAPPIAPAAAAQAGPWLAGLLLRGAAQWQALHPAEAAAGHAALVQASFRAHLLSPWTTFLALENEAQRAALLRKQAQTLAANANLDTLEADPNHVTAVPLDDYLGWLLLLAVAGGLWRLRE